MRVLLDECVPRALRGELPGYEVKTIAEAGWAGVKNGELLRRAVEADFQVFVTMDKGIPHQQNLRVFTIAIVRLAAHTNRLADTRPLMPLLLKSLNAVQPGTETVLHS